VSKFPKVPFRATDPLQDYYSDTNGNMYSVAKLIDDTKHLKPFDMPIAGIDLSGRIWHNCDIYSLSFHCKRVNEADLSKPIIIAWDGSIADGRHRLIKAIVKGKRTIKAVRMTWQPTPCRKASNE
jgi:hypothetical protein